MAVAVVQQTLGEIVVEVSRLCGYLQNQGPATAGSTTSLTDATNAQTPTANVNLIKGQYLYVWGGTSAGTAKEINAYGTIGVFGWTAAATAPDSTSTWVRLTKNPRRILDAIDAVTRQAAFQQAIPVVSDSIITNNLLECYGAMEGWSSGTAVAPDGWTLSGSGAAVARDAGSAARHMQGNYQASLTPGSGAVGILSRTIPMRLVRLCTGKSVRIRGFFAANAASDAVVRLISRDSGATDTNTDRTSTYTGSNVEDIDDISTASINLPDPVTRLEVQLRGVANASAMQFDAVFVGGPPIRDYDILPELIGIASPIYMESDWAKGDYNIRLHYGDTWRLRRKDVGISGETTNRGIIFNTDLPPGRNLRMNAYRAPDIQATTTSNVEPNPEWLSRAAARRLLEEDYPTEGSQARLSSVERWFGDASNRDTIYPNRGKRIAWSERV